MPGTSLAGDRLGLWALTAEGSGFSPWSGSLDPTSHMVQSKNKRRKFYADSFNTRIADWSRETTPLRMSFPHSVALVGDTGRLRRGEGGASPGSSGRSWWHWTGPGASLLFPPRQPAHVRNVAQGQGRAPHNSEARLQVHGQVREGPETRSDCQAEGLFAKHTKHTARAFQSPEDTACVLWHSGVKSAIDSNCKPY